MTLVNLINELSGAKDSTLDDIEDSNSIETGSDAEVELSPGLDQEVNSPTSPNSTPVIEDIKKECKIIDSTISESEKNPNENSVENNINLKKEFYEDDNMNGKTNVPIVGETIEESVMIVKGEGSGKECDTGNPDETNTQNETSKNEDVKKPKLWSIETICSSSKEVREEIISVPKTGFFFGDDSVPCFNNVSNGENSHIKEDKLIVDPLKENEELENKSKTDETDSTTLSHSEESLNKECSSKNEDDLASNNISKQSVFNIKVHEEEVQITERKANEVFTKSNSNIKEDIQQTNVYTPTSVDTYSKPQESQLHETSQVFGTNDDNQSHVSNITDKSDDTGHTVSSNIYENKIIDKHKIISDSEEAEYKNIKDDQQSTEYASSHISVEKQTVEQENLSSKSDGSYVEVKNQQKNDHQSHTEIADLKTDEHIFDSKIEIDKQFINKINQDDEVEKVSTSYENVITKESPINIVKECVNINDQKNVDMVDQKSCELDKKIFMNVVTENQISLNTSSISTKEEAITHLISGNNETNKEVSKDINKPIQTTNDSVTNATYTNYDLNQHTSNEYSSVNTIGLNSKAYDQTITDTINPCIRTSKLIDDDQFNKKSVNTSHNISNIINTEENVSKSVEAKEQSTNIDANKNKQLDICQILDKNNLEKNILKEQKIVMNVDSPAVSNNKHSLDNILKKSDRIKDVVEFPNLDKKTTEQIEPTDKSAPSDLELSLQKMVKPEINIEKSETKCINISNDLTIAKEECNLIKNNESIALNIPSVQEKKIETIHKIQSIKEKEVVKTIDEISNVQKKEIVETVDKIQNIKEKKTVKTCDKISSVQEKEIVEIINKIPSVQEKEKVETINTISSVQEKKIVESIDKIPNSQEKEIVETTDKISNLQDEEIVNIDNQIPNIEEKETVDIIDKIPSSQKKEIVDPVDKTSKNDDKNTVITMEQYSVDAIKEDDCRKTNPKTEEIKQNIKYNLTISENKNDSIHKEKLNLEEEEVKNALGDDENLLHDRSETMEVSKEVDEENINEALQNGKIKLSFIIYLKFYINKIIIVFH